MKKHGYNCSAQPGPCICSWNTPTNTPTSKCEVSPQYGKDEFKNLHFYCDRCGIEMDYNEVRACGTSTTHTTDTGWEKTKEDIEDLLDNAEKRGEIKISWQLICDVAGILAKSGLIQHIAQEEYTRGYNDGYEKDAADLKEEYERGRTDAQAECKCCDGCNLSYERGQKSKSQELNHALYALGLMWNQYCGEKGHLFMSAGEHASDVLEHHGLLHDDDEEADWDKLDSLLEAALETPS